MAYILVADDDEILVGMVRHRLTMAGHECVTVEDGEQLLQRMRYRLADAILLGAMMPVKDGMETLFALKGNPEYAPIPVVMMTARRSETDVLAALKAGPRTMSASPSRPKTWPCG